MSNIRATTISDETGNGPIALTKQHAAKAWINADGTGTISIRDSFGTSSIVDTGTGQITFNFSNAFANLGYCPTASTNQFHEYVTNGGKSVNSNLIAAANSGHGNVDSAQMNCTCHGDLA